MDSIEPALNLTIDSFVSLTFLVALFIYIIYSVILLYHWRTYGTDAKITSYTLILYFATTIPLLLIAGILALII